MENEGVRARVGPEEWNLRVELAAAYRLVAMYGWDDIIFTHISARVPGDAGHFLINPYGLLFEEITASSLVKVDLAGEKVEPSSWPVNPAGFTIHSAVHQVREDAACVVHLHTDDGTAVSCMEAGLLPISQAAMVVCSHLAYHEYEGLALDHDERPRLQADLGEKRAMLLWNHGTLTLGPTVGEAFMLMYFLERACSIQVRAIAAGALHEPVTPGVADKVAAQVAAPEYGTQVVDRLAWPALKRRLDRHDPSYKT